MANILISPLGTGYLGEYRKTNYVKNNKSIETAVISKALLEFESFQSIIFIGTKNSIWHALYKEYSADIHFSEKYYEALKNWTLKKDMEPDLRLLKDTIHEYIYHKSEISCVIEIILIEKGINKKEIIKNSQKILKLADNFNDNDTIVLDITHNFRSIPLLIYSLLDYLINVLEKKIQFKTAYYGMMDGDKTPIVDLKHIIEISGWSDAARDFVRYGNGKELSKMMKNTDGRFSEKIIKELEKISDAISVNNLRIFSESLDVLAHELKKDTGNIAFEMIKPHLQNFIDRFALKKTTFEKLIEACDWFYDHNRTIGSLICLYEAYLKLMHETYNDGFGKGKNEDKHFKRLMNEILSVEKNKFTEIPEWGKLIENIKVIKEQRDMAAHTSLVVRNRATDQFDYQLIKTARDRLKYLYNYQEMENFKSKIPLSFLEGRITNKGYEY